MLNTIVVLIRFIVLIFGCQKQVALENAALRQQLAVFKRNVPRPKLNNISAKNQEVEMRSGFGERQVSITRVQ